MTSVSVIIPCYNSKFDLDQFVRFMEHWNDPQTFEIIVAHDDRVNDGSAAFIAALENEFPNVKHVSRTKAQTVTWAENIVTARANPNSTFDATILAEMSTNLARYEQGIYVDETSVNVRFSNAPLLNAAAAQAQGDILFFAPRSSYSKRGSVSALPAFLLTDLVEFVNANKTQDGYLYTQLGGPLAQITNQGFRAVKNAILNTWYTVDPWSGDPDAVRVPPPKIRAVQIARKKWMRSHPLIYPSITQQYDLWRNSLSHYYLINPWTGGMTALDATEYMRVAQTVCTDAKDKKTLPFERTILECHVMTRATWNTTGGFYEGAVERFVADRKMAASCRSQQVGCQNLFILKADPHRVIGNVRKHVCTVADTHALTHPVIGVNPTVSLVSAEDRAVLEAEKEAGQ